MENIQFDLLKGDLDINLGSILENVMAQELKANGFGLYYFDSKRYGELDFVAQNGMKTDLIEIKSGNDYKKHNALDRVRAVTEWKFGKTTVFCKGNVEKDDVDYLPWYMIMFYTQQKPEHELKHEVDLSALDM